MTQGLPTISIVIPTHNRWDIIEENLYSLKNQTFSNFEVIVSDNTFTGNDGRNIFDKYADDRFKYVKPEHELTMQENWEFALKHACGEYIGILEDKHYLYLDSIERLSKAITDNGFPDCVHYGVDRFTFDKTNKSGTLFRSVNKSKSHITSGEQCIDNILKWGVYNLHSFIGLTWGGSITTGLVRREILDEIRKERGTIFLPYTIPDVGGIVLDILSRSKRVLFLHDSYLIAGNLFTLSRSNGYGASISVKKNKEFIQSSRNGEHLIENYAIVPGMYATVVNCVTADYNFAIATNPRLKAKKVDKINALAAIHLYFGIIEDWGDCEFQEIMKYHNVVDELSENEKMELRERLTNPPRMSKSGVEGVFSEEFGKLVDFLDRRNRKNPIEELIKFCHDSRRIFLYGAGYYGRIVSSLLLRHGIYIDGFIVSDKSNNPESIKDVPVYSIKEVDITEGDGCILTLLLKNHSDILKLLHKSGCAHIFDQVPYLYLNTYGYL